MDPNLFHLNYERIFEVLVAIVFLSIIVERALSVLFESRIFIENTESGEVVVKMRNLSESSKNGSYKKTLKLKKKSGLKEFIAFGVSVAVCWLVQFDALTISFVSSETMSEFGYIFTGAIVAGGSKGSIKLFKDWMGFMSSAEEQRLSIRNSNSNQP